jgi:hypothetical protein
MGKERERLKIPSSESLKAVSADAVRTVFATMPASPVAMALTGSVPAAVRLKAEALFVQAAVEH